MRDEVLVIKNFFCSLEMSIMPRCPSPWANSLQCRAIDTVLVQSYSDYVSSYSSIFYLSFFQV
jgi:hypothetical protein